MRVEQTGILHACSRAVVCGGCKPLQVPRGTIIRLSHRNLEISLSQHIEQHRLLIVDGTNLLCKAAADAKRRNSDISLQRAFEDYLNFVLLAAFAKVMTFVVVFDRPGGWTSSRRHRLDPEYLRRRKGRRPPSPRVDSEVTNKLRPYIRIVREKGGWPFIAKSGMEADDTIGAICTAAKRAIRVAGQVNGRCPILVVSGDTDMQQFIDPVVCVLHLLPFATSEDPLGLQFVDDTSFRDRYGFPPSSYPDFLSLAGKQNSSIGGVGVGEKSSKKIISKFLTIEDAADAEGRGLLKSWTPAVQKALQRDGEVFQRSLRNKRLFKAETDPKITLTTSQHDKLNRILYAYLKHANVESFASPTYLHSSNQDPCCAWDTHSPGSLANLAWARPFHVARWRKVKPWAERMVDLYQEYKGKIVASRTISTRGHVVDVMVGDDEAVMICCPEDLEERDSRIACADSSNGHDMEFFFSFIDHQMDKRASPVKWNLKGWMKHHGTLLRKEGLKTAYIPLGIIPK